MFVRCDRCRAVYALDSEPGDPPVVRCGRCEQVFVAREPVRSVAVEGRLGGAADPAAVVRAPPGGGPALPPAARRPRPAVRLATRQPPEKSGAGKWLLFGGALAVLFGAGALVAWALGRFERRPALSEPDQAALKLAQTKLLLDDEADLEAARAAFDHLARSYPRAPRFLARGALAAALLGASNRAEAEDLQDELERLDRSIAATSSAGDPDARARVAQAREEEEDLRARLKVVSQTAGARLHDAAQEADQALQANPGLKDAVRARMIGAAETGHLTAAVRDARRLGTGDPWADYVSGLTWLERNRGPAGLQQAEADFRAALAVNPGMIRATWALGRVAAREQDYRRAQKFFEEALARSPRHEGAQRGLSLAKSLIAQTPAPPSAVPAMATAPQR